MSRLSRCKRLDPLSHLLSLDIWTNHGQHSLVSGVIALDWAGACCRRLFEARVVLEGAWSYVIGLVPLVLAAKSLSFATGAGYVF